MRRHVAWTVGFCFRQIRLIRNCIKSLPLGAAKAVVAAFFTSRVERYNNLLPGAPVCFLDGLQWVLSILQRGSSATGGSMTMSPLLRDVLHWLPVQFRIE